ncbi:MAG: aminoacyl-tRNA hydrolase [Chloroflexi bacterium]|nr:aminoacyl-tRNA hydrolase [Chloroflexota bacterium]MCH8349365.1 aminoacyl-tRNA hydrolase [Chloroflexota bacterium]MCI0780028.1 aminoacyl-tRNA hydrolase [Chloroflexota bacterium]MCI0797979.1 aminoacyl-tRNA hydrolase [Chloroflexota bacterium]MCI0823762.1 aminoacyl-tRNA hydrolase [Chloroflexota bacterium]
MPKIRLIVGLGNPGARYAGTRHNLGFRCVDLMARRWEIPASDRRAKAVLGRGHHAGQEIVLAKPRTFMNNSGEGIAYLLTRFGAQPEDLVVIYDDMELPVGRLRLRLSGSDGGHKGMRSIIASLKTTNFPRLRVGIGHPPAGIGVVEYVLSSFLEDESKTMDQVVRNVVAAADCLLEEGIDVAMNRFN